MLGGGFEKLIARYFKKGQQEHYEQLEELVMKTGNW